MIFQNAPLTEITPVVLAKMLKSKKFYISNEMLIQWRERMRVEVIAEL